MTGQWSTIFKELTAALIDAKKEYKHLKDTSTTRIRVLLVTKELLHYKVPLSDVDKTIWNITDEHPNIIYFCIETSRGLPIYSTTRYNIIQGEGAVGDFTTIEQFAKMPDERKDLVVRLLHTQIQDRFVKAGIIEEEGQQDES